MKICSVCSIGEGSVGRAALVELSSRRVLYKSLEKGLPLDVLQAEGHAADRVLVFFFPRTGNDLLGGACLHMYGPVDGDLWGWRSVFLDDATVDLAEEVERAYGRKVAWIERVGIVPQSGPFWYSDKKFLLRLVELLDIRSDFTEAL